jgi:hypothetical protein
LDQGYRDEIFTDSIDVCAVVKMGDALYKTYDCPANRCERRDPGALPAQIRSGTARQALGARKRDGAKQ